MKEIKDLIEKNNSTVNIRAFSSVYRIGVKSRIVYWLYAIIILLLIILFLPWTQNIRARGTVTTLRQEQRPQELNTIISGRIIKWYVKEGDYVKRGDTLVQLAEVKDSYLDPQLLNRTNEQLGAKKASVEFYNNKVEATNAQISAIEMSLQLKLQQLKLKVTSDSMEALAANNDLKIAEEQYRRQRIMRDSGLVSLVQLEQRNQIYQNALAKKMSAEIKFINTKTELSQIRQDYAEKVFKARGEIAEAQSSIATGQGEISKLSNQYSNYAIRAGQYYMLAPQDGQIVNAFKSGINEIMKEGERVADIVPTHIDYAVEMYVKPVDLPLLSKGQDVRFLFDGFPAIVFSGWPQASYGMFSGKVVAIESSVNKNGKFRVLVAENNDKKKWPKALKMGAGASGIALLKDVPIWYELWRNINGFPPDYYVTKQKVNEETKK